MSSDNGVYILETKDGFRVVHAQAIDNLYWWNFGKIMTKYGMQDKWIKKNEINPEMLIEYFGDCKVFRSREEAEQEAYKIYEEIINDDFYPICEYGIVSIDCSNINFPK